MDTFNLESSNGMQQDQSWLQTLLRRTYGPTTQRDGTKKYQNGFSPTIHPDVLKMPLLWKNLKLFSSIQ